MSTSGRIAEESKVIERAIREGEQWLRDNGGTDSRGRYPRWFIDLAGSAQEVARLAGE